METITRTVTAVPNRLDLGPNSDIAVLLGRKPFPRPLSHVTITIEVAEHLSPESDLPVFVTPVSRTIAAYNNEVLVASSTRVRINRATKTIRFYKNATRLH